MMMMHVLPVVFTTCRVRQQEEKEEEEEEDPD